VKLEIKELLKFPGSEEVFEFNENWDYLETGQGIVKFASSVSFSGKVTNIGNSVLAKGDVTTRVTLKCNRCLKLFEHDVAVDYLEEFCTPDEEENEDCIAYDGEVIDFRPSVAENLILVLPMKWLCNVECHGICSQCGQDLNEIRCDCREEKVDPRMQALQKFFEEKE